MLTGTVPNSGASSIGSIAPSSVLQHGHDVDSIWIIFAISASLRQPIAARRDHCRCVGWPEPLRIDAARHYHRRSPLSVAKTGERVALIVQAKTDTFTGRRKRRRFLLSGGNRRSLIPTRHGAPRKADHKESRVVVHWLMVDQGICHAAI